MNVTQISIGRFHHFHLARQLERHHLLESIYTGYPRFKLEDEKGIPPEKIKTFPWVRTPYMMRGRVGLDRWDWLSREWEWLGQQSIDKHVASKIEQPTVLVALSSSGLYAGRKAKATGGHYICDRGSTHIRYQDELLKTEYKRWGYDFSDVDPRILAKEEEEYEVCDKITVPSEFVKRSFIRMGVPEHKISKVMYGARLERFRKVDDPDPSKFTVLWVGAVTLRKGFMYLLRAFQALKHPHKELVVIGHVFPEIRRLLTRENLQGVYFKGTVDNSELPLYYSRSHVFLLPSVEDGFGMVMGEALSCGCPVIASNHTGAEDLYQDGKEGFIVSVRSEQQLKERMRLLMEDPFTQKQMSAAGEEKVKSLGGWNNYGDEYSDLVRGLQPRQKGSPIFQ